MVTRCNLQVANGSRNSVAIKYSHVLMSPPKPIISIILYKSIRSHSLKTTNVNSCKQHTGRNTSTFNHFNYLLTIFLLNCQIYIGPFTLHDILLFL